jgi:hypothetical protein
MEDSVWRQVRVEDVLWLAAREHEMRPIDILGRLIVAPYSLPKPAEGYLSDIINGRRPLPDTVLGAALLHLLDMSLADLALKPADYQTVWAHLELARERGSWPQPDGNGRGGKRRSEQAKTGSGRNPALAGRSVLAASGVNSTAAA